ncbi:MAG: FAD-dependent oxidoreductase [Boseongicola sp.]|nr:MAG: FAD-dependent oxidoreductase [Boseongicola sp.]
MSGRKTIAIIGAGIVGVSTAIWLQRDGHDVILIDKEGPAAGTSYGNGGVLASCSMVPVTGPGLISKAPRMLFDPNQPLFLKWGYLPKLAPWLMRYLGNANAADTRRIASAVAGIVGDSVAEHQALAAGTGAEKWIVPSDYLYIYNDRAHFEGDAFAWGLRRENGVVWDELEGADFKAYDPVFSDELGFAVRLENHGRISDPGQYVKDLAAAVERSRGRIVIGTVSEVVRENGTVKGIRVDGEAISCDAVVLATGAWSGPLAKNLGLKVPLESERGYHLELWEPSSMPKSPVMVASGKFVATPMGGRLRLAGVVEFGGLDAPPSKGPIGLLRKNAKAAFPGITWKHETEWMGHRPAPADSIPIIGEVPGVAGAYTGFGHHHIGLTGGPVTGRLLAQLISGKTPNLDLSAYSPARFAA